MAKLCTNWLGGVDSPVGLSFLSLCTINLSRKKRTHMKNAQSKHGKMRKFFGYEHWIGISVLLALYDAVVVSGSYFLALWFRFDCKFRSIPARYLDHWMKFTPIYIVFCICIFYALRLYKSIWRFASYSELMRTALSSLITTVFHTAAITIIFGRMPLSYYFIGAIIQFVFVISIRFSYRLITLLRKEASSFTNTECDHVMLIGAGSAGQMILRDINSAREIGDKVVCIIDDNTNKVGRYIDGVPIVGGREEILASVEKYNIKKIFLAMPSATVAERRDILNICKETNCELKNLPGMYQLVNGEVSVSALKKVSIEDLLGRDPIKVEMEEVFDFIHEKTVLVTGGGARCILNTTKRNDGITRVCGIDEIESMSFLSEKGKITFPKIMKNFYPCNQPAGCIIGTTRAKPYFTRVLEMLRNKSMSFETGFTKKDTLSLET